MCHGDLKLLGRHMIAQCVEANTITDVKVSHCHPEVWFQMGLQQLHHRCRNCNNEVATAFVKSMEYDLRKFKKPIFYFLWFLVDVSVCVRGVFRWFRCFDRYNKHRLSESIQSEKCRDKSETVVRPCYDARFGLSRLINIVSVKDMIVFRFLEFPSCFWTPQLFIFT